MDTTQDLILRELRALRCECNTHALQTGERLATVESQMLCAVRILTARYGHSSPPACNPIEQCWPSNAPTTSDGSKVVAKRGI